MSSEPNSRQPGVSRPVILVADDDENIRVLISTHLDWHGYDVVEAADGREALDVLDEATPDLALIDVEMPGCDGYELLTAMKSRVELRDLPVLLVSARTLAADVIRAMGLGAQDYLRKPFEPAEMLARVTAALRIKQLQDDITASASTTRRRYSPWRRSTS